MTERIKHWQLTQERALELYELIQSSLDPSTWEVFIKSENTKMTIQEFLEKGRKRIIYQPENSTYAPSVVADDALVIIDSLPASFDNLRNRLEDSFRSILVVNEDMNNFIASIEHETDTAKDEVENLRAENERLVSEVAHLKQELDDKMMGITPLTDVINIRVKEIIKLYEDFKKCLGNESEMKKFLPVFEKECEYTIKLIELKRKQVLESKQFHNDEVEELGEEPEYLPDEGEEEVVDDDAVLGEVEMPEELQKHDPKYYNEAVKLVPAVGEPACPNEQCWINEMDVCMRALAKGRKYKPGQ